MTAYRLTVPAHPGARPAIIGRPWALGATHPLIRAGYTCLICDRALGESRVVMVHIGAQRVPAQLRAIASLAHALCALGQEPDPTALTDGAAPTSTPVCACGHNLGLHTDQGCAATDVDYINATTVPVPCTCTAYDGPPPLPDLYTPDPRTEHP